MIPAEHSLRGLHHVTAIASDPQANVDFYAGDLGLRLAKVTVNFDDPGAYHLYYGDETASPGSAMTFFPWPDARPGRVGAGQVAVTAFSVPKTAIPWWTDRLAERAVQIDAVASRGDEEVVAFRDPDGLRLELVGGSIEDLRSPWSGGEVPAEHGIRGFHSVTLDSLRPEATVALLEKTMALTRVREIDGGLRLAIGPEAPGQIVDVRTASGERGAMGKGVVHHVAFEVEDAAAEDSWQTELSEAGMSVTPIQERVYFRSVYYREPGGVLYELATSGPGFADDEAVESLGTELKLPPWMESRRDAIVARLPRLTANGVEFP